MTNSRLIKTFASLATIASPSGEESAISRFLTSELTDIGFTVDQDDAGNIYAFLEGSGEPIMLCGHMDTVPLGSGSRIKAIIQPDGTITSDGTTILGADNKDNLAAIIEAVHRVRESGATNVPVEVLITVGEEQISRGATLADLTRFSARNCIISDTVGPFGTIVTQAPSCVHFELRFSGKRAHVRDSANGVSAILLAARVLAAYPFEELASAGVIVNIAYAEGGLGQQGVGDGLGDLPRNTIPDEMVLYGQARSLDHSRLMSELAKLEDSARAECATYGAVLSAHYEVLAKGYVNEEGDDFMARLSKAITAVAGSCRFAASEGGSDANVLNDRGIKTIVISSAHRNSHQPSETLVISELERLTELLMRMITAE